MAPKSRFKKQYKPIRFGDRPDSDTVEGHRKAMAEAAETRAYNRRMKQLAAEDAVRREGLLPECLDSFLEVTSIPAMNATKFERQKGPPLLRGLTVFFNEGYGCALWRYRT
jgi:hypothetical protein